MKIPMVLACIVLGGCSATQKQVEAAILTEADKLCADALSVGTEGDVGTFCKGVVVAEPLVAQAIVLARKAPDTSKVRLASHRSGL